VRPHEEIDLRVYKTYSWFIKSLENEDDVVPNIVLFIPGEEFEASKVRQIRLAEVESPIYIVTEGFNEKDYLTCLSMGVNEIIQPPFGGGDFSRILNGRSVEEVPFPHNSDIIREGHIRLDFLLPSKLSRILGVNRLISFLGAEFGFPPEECRVNLPMVMDEVLSNAILHGNKGNERLKVRVRIYISFKRIFIQVEDEGEGFIPTDIDDPTEMENIYRNSGRGVYLINKLMDEVRFKKGGRLVEIEKINSRSLNGSHNSS
jgi:anti-sigma regulatory factor (Ser/Thr protein kinase)